MSDIFFIGVDGGGSKTSYVLMDQEHHIIKTYKNGPSTYDVVSAATFKETILDGLSNVLPDKGFIASVFLGIGGIISNNDERKVVRLIKESGLFDNRTLVRAGNDIYNAFYSTFSDSGICLIIGTGCVVYGRTSKGKELRLSGYGYLEGDKGSGYDISMSALRLLARMYDGILEFDDTFRLFSMKINVHDKIGLIHYFNNTGRSEIAANAKFLLENSKSRYIQEILDSCADNFALYVDFLLKRFPDIERKMTIIGSCGSSPVYLDKILERIHARHPDIQYIPHLHDADFGAACCAMALWKKEEDKK